MLGIEHVAFRKTKKRLVTQRVNQDENKLYLMVVAHFECV